jgi:hypothetical protein
VSDGLDRMTPSGAMRASSGTLRDQDDRFRRSIQRY